MIIITGKKKFNLHSISFSSSSNNLKPDNPKNWLNYSFIWKLAEEVTSLQSSVMVTVGSKLDTLDTENKIKKCKVRLLKDTKSAQPKPLINSKKKKKIFIY